MEKFKRILSFSHKAVSAATSKPEDAFSIISKFDVVLLLDDSTSMAGSRWQEATKALQALASEMAKYDKYEIKLRFFNSSETLVTSNPQEMAGRLENFALTPKTPLGRQLGRLLDNYMKRLKATGLKLKPMIFVVVTDGLATDGVQAEEAIMRTSKALGKYNANPEQISIHFVQIGNEPKATDYLRRVSGIMLSSQARVRVTVSATPLKAGVEPDLMKMLLDTINLCVDQMGSAVLIGGK